MDFSELKQKSRLTVLLRGKSGRGKTLNAAKVALQIAHDGGRVFIAATESGIADTLVSLVEDSSNGFSPETVENIDYREVSTFEELDGILDNEGTVQAEYDLLVVDSLDHKHSLVLKHVTDAKHDNGADWQEYARIYGLEKALMNQVGSPETNILCTLDPDGGSMDKPKGAQTNVQGYFSIVVDLRKDGDEWNHKIRNWVNKSEVIGKQLAEDIDEGLALELSGRMDLGGDA